MSSGAPSSETPAAPPVGDPVEMASYPPAGSGHVPEPVSPEPVSPEPPVSEGTPPTVPVEPSATPATPPTTPAPPESPEVPPVESAAPPASPAPPAPSEPPPSASLRDLATGAGFDVSGLDDSALANQLIQAVQASQSNQQYVEYGQRYLRNASEFEQFLRDKEASTTPPSPTSDASKPESLWNPPEYNPHWMSQVERDGETICGRI